MSIRACAIDVLFRVAALLFRQNPPNVGQLAKIHMLDSYAGETESGAAGALKFDNNPIKSRRATQGQPKYSGLFQGLYLSSSRWGVVSDDVIHQILQMLTPYLIWA